MIYSAIAADSASSSQNSPAKLIAVYFTLCISIEDGFII
jgi:hypothetical protein